MPTVAKRTISLPSEHDAFIEAKIASGAYASASEVVRAGLRALKERDDAVERWLREDVVPVYDAMKREPARGIPAEKVFRDLRSRPRRANRTK
ncbi:type II toxin-antitoxin system ParD family antitoxin [soil metagenome]